MFKPSVIVVSVLQFEGKLAPPNTFPNSGAVLSTRQNPLHLLVTR